MENEPVRPKENTDIADYILSCHDGDPQAAINAMLEEIEHLQVQLSIAARAMGHGYTRGWKPMEARDVVED